MQNTLQESTASPDSVPMLDPVQIQKMVEENHLLNDKVACLEISLTEAKQKIVWFEEQLRLSRHRQFGNRSEVLKTLQAEMIFNADETPFACRENEAVADEIAIPILTVASRKTKVGRTLDLSQLPHQRQLHDLEDSEKTCQGCGSVILVKQFSNKLL